MKSTRPQQSSAAAQRAKSLFWGVLTRWLCIANVLFSPAIVYLRLDEPLRDTLLFYPVKWLPLLLVVAAFVAAVVSKRFKAPEEPGVMTRAEMEQRKQQWQYVGIASFGVFMLLVWLSSMFGMDGGLRPLLQLYSVVALVTSVLAFVAHFGYSPVQGGSDREWLGRAGKAVPAVSHYMLEVGRQGRAMTACEVSALKREHGAAVRRFYEQGLDTLASKLAD